jgi:hypothetical protein
MTKSMSHSHEAVNYESTLELNSATYPSVKFRIRRPSFRRRSVLIGQVRELGMSLQCLEAGEGVAERIEAFHIRAKIDQLYLEWGLEKIDGMQIDGEAVCVESLMAKGPEDLTREILEQIKRQCTMSEAERKN